MVIETNVHEQMCDVCVNDMDRCETRKRTKHETRDFLWCIFNDIRKSRM